VPRRKPPAWARTLRDLRQAKGWTQVELATRAGVRANTLSAALLGQSSPRLVTLEQITAALDVPLWRLFVSAEQAKLLAQQAETDKVAELSRTVETLIRQLKQRRSGKR
jgi:transcriptional regulator with XRE-family HTH domain